MELISTQSPAYYLDSTILSAIVESNGIGRCNVMLNATNMIT